jgi:uncharacterized membrane protein
VDIVPFGTPIPPPPDTVTVANGLNNWGQVVGHTVIGVSRAFVWQHGRMRELPGLTSGGSSDAAAINDFGRIVGGALDERSLFVPVTWTRRGISRLANDGAGYAVDVNNRGQIVGNSAAGCLLWQDAQSEPQLLTGFDGNFCEVTAIDEHGAIAGRARHADGEGFGFVWEDGAVIDINASAGGEELVYSELWDIDNGVAVGIGDPAEGRRTGLVWSEREGVHRLDVTINGVAVNRWGVVTSTPTESGAQFTFTNRRGVRFDLGSVVAENGTGGLKVNDRFQMIFGAATEVTHAFFCD